jgi:hypothetical protein
MEHSDRIAIAAQTWIYGYPMVYGLGEIDKIPKGEATMFAGRAVAWNTFGYVRELIDPATEFVSPNNDTLYVIAACDVGNGPLVLDVPDVGDRYYVLQFVDAWTNNFAYVGKRATGTAAGTFLLVGPGEADVSVPENMTLIEAPTNVFVIVGRLQVNGEPDLPTVHALQDRFTLAPLDQQSAPVGIPSPAAGVPDELHFWERLRLCIAAYPPPAEDAEFIAAAGTLGLLDVESPYLDPDPDLAAVLIAGAQQGDALIEGLAGGSNDPTGWSTAKHMFDYNLDRCGLGTIDTPEWKIDDRKTAYVTRAVIARAGLWGNHGYEACYDFVWTDENGDKLDGINDYEVTFSPPPPVSAFWSLTMYSTPHFYLVANPIDRYSIGDRTAGLQYASDGSVTIYMQQQSPGPDRESNWLPTPPAAFRPILRTYGPSEAILDDSYQLPQVRRTR